MAHADAERAQTVKALSNLRSLFDLIRQAKTPEEAREALAPLIDRIELKSEVEQRGQKQSKGRWVSGIIHFKSLLAALGAAEEIEAPREDNGQPSEVGYH